MLVPLKRNMSLKKDRILPQIHCYKMSYKWQVVMDMSAQQEKMWTGKMKHVLQNYIRKLSAILSHARLLASKLLQRLPEDYSVLFKQFLKIYEIYGGNHSLVRSPFLHIAITIALLISLFTDCKEKWFEIAMSCLPSIIGMSFTGYALILTFGNEQFREALRGDINKEEHPSQDKVSSPYIQLSSTFAYFLIIQVIALIFAIICKYLMIKNILITLVGITLILYSLLLVIASSINTFFLSCIYDSMPKKENE